MICAGFFGGGEQLMDAERRAPEQWHDCSEQVLAPAYTAERNGRLCQSCEILEGAFQGQLQTV